MLRISIFLLFHLLSWNRSCGNLTGTTSMALGNHTSDILSPKNQTAAVNFAEGGKITINTPNTASKSSEPNVLDLLAEGAPQAGSSGVVPRKGVHTSNVKGRKGAPLCLDDSDIRIAGVPCFKEKNAGTDSGSEEPDAPLVLIPKNVTTSAKNLTEQSNKPMKPAVTVVPADSDEILRSLKNDRNVVIPIAALVCTPLIVLLLLFVYKRYKDSRGNGYYERMGFLIEDIYND